MANSLPQIQKTNKGGRGSGSVIASIGKSFVQKQQAMGRAASVRSSANRSKRGSSSKRSRGRGRQARADRPSSPTEAMEKIVNSATVTKKDSISGDSGVLHSKAFQIYANLINFVKKSVQELVQKVKTIIGLSKEAKPANEVSDSAISGSPKMAGTPSIEETRETAEEAEKQTELQNDSLSELSKIRVLLEKIRAAMLKGGMGGGDGGGLLDTISDVANIASLVRGGRGGGAARAAGAAAKGGKFARMANIARGGGLAKLAAARNASKPVQALARGSDKIVKTASAAKEGIKGFASRTAGRASQLLGFGTKMGTAAATGAAGAATGVASGAASSAIGAASGAATGAASAAGSAATGAASGAAGSGGGWFSNLMSKANPKTAIKKLVEGSGGKILKAVIKVPIIGGLIETFLTGKEIKEIKENPDMSPEEKRKAIGRRIATGLGGIIGGALFGAGATALTATGIPGFLLSGVAYILGDMAGRWLTGTIMDAIGGDETVYNLFSSIPGLGKYIAIDEDQEAGKNPAEEAKSELAQMEQQGQIPPPPPPPPTGDVEPAPLSSALQRTPTSTSGSAPTSASTVISASPSSAEITPSAPLPSGEAIRKETQQSINTNIMQSSPVNTTPQVTTSPSGNVINNYYNNVSSGGSSMDSSAATSSAEPDGTMRKLLSGNVGGVST